MAKSILFVFRHAPYGTTQAREGLEALLAAAVYEQKIAVLFMNDGVLQLLGSQEPQEQKNHARMLSALPMYGVEQIYVDTVSLQQRGLNSQELLLNPKSLDKVEIQALMHSFDHLLSF